jgi:hypothetical protein
MTHTQTPQEYKIVFTNSAGKMHANAKCGMTRSNRSHNVPCPVEEVTNPCGRCGHNEYREATDENIDWAWTFAFNVSRRSPYGGMPREYCTERAEKAKRFVVTGEWK